MSDRYDPKEHINRLISSGKIVSGAVTGDITDPFTGERFVDLELIPKRPCDFIKVDFIVRRSGEE